MTEILYAGLNARDLRGSSLAELLVHIEADLAIVDRGEEIYSELAFPVAELARALARWTASAEDTGTGFRFASMSFAEEGAVEITRVPSGWQLGSVFEPGRRSAPVPLADLVITLTEFIARVRRDVEVLGLDAALVFSGGIDAGPARGSART